MREIEITASPVTVFSFLTDPLRFVRWLGRRAEIDPRPGGLFRIDVNGRDVIRGEFVEIEPPVRLVVTWGWEGEDSSVPPGSTRLEISLVARGKGTLLRLSHSGLPEEPRRRHEAGWDHYLARLAASAAGGDPSPDPLGTLETKHG